MKIKNCKSTNQIGTLTNIHKSTVCKNVLSTEAEERTNICNIINGICECSFGGNAF